jgi:hypothetical protein
MGEKLFNSDHLENGEIPKIFSFTKFNPKNVIGSFDCNQAGQPILKSDKAGALRDN